jgi:hypothetical protein
MHQLAFRLSPLVAFYEVEVDEAVSLLIEWRHPLHLNGEKKVRPFGKLAYVMEERGRTCGCVILASTCNASVCQDEGLHRYNTVDIARIARSLDRRDEKCLRAILRITREYLVPYWLEQDWPRWQARSELLCGRPQIEAVSSTSLPGTKGSMYRLDGFTKLRTSKPKKPSGYQKASAANAIADGVTGLWVYRYPDPIVRNT